MKQKVVTRAIIKHDGKVLLLRRHGGRPSIDGLFELPGGRVHIFQQPEDALAHALSIHLGVTNSAAQLVDVMTFVDPDDREVQYVFIVFEAILNPTGTDITLSSEYNGYVWKKMSDIQHSEITQSTQQILGLQSVPYAPGSSEIEVKKTDDEKTTYLSLRGFADGGSRGNPGPAASGFVLIDTTEKVIDEGGAFLGVATNNVAEYQAVYLALERALELGAEDVAMKLDSQLVVNQMNGIYKIKHPDLIPIHNRVRELIGRFKKVTFTHVRREFNTLADGMVNKILDEHSL